MANFVSKFSHFCYHGNQGGSAVIINVSVKLLDLENIFGSISCIG